jgi:cobalt-zinc-cadmium efflux system protein
LLREAEEELHEHFEIRHVTLQIESPAYAQSCALQPGLGCQAT